MNMLQIIKGLVVRLYATQYAGSRLRCGWALITPIFIASGITFIFERIFHHTSGNTTYFIYCTYLVWHFFAGTIIQGQRLFLDQRAIFQQLGSNRWALALAFVIFKFLFALPGIVVACGITLVCTGKLVSLAPVGIVVLGVAFLRCLVGLTYLFATWSIFYPDISHGIDLILIFLLWFSPVFYGVNSFPVEYVWLQWLNPLSWFFDALQGALGFKHYYSTQYATIGFVLFSTFIGLFGWSYYCKHNKEAVQLL